MPIATTRFCATLSALLYPCFPGSGAWAADRIETVASVTITRSATVTVVNNTPLQTLLLTTAIAPAGVVFTASNAGPVTVGASGGTAAGGATGGPPGAGATTTSGAGLPDGDGGAGPALVAFGGSLGGTTINGDAVSVSVGNMSGGSAAGSGRVPVVIAQYN
jgi:hypothetical protein